MSRYRLSLRPQGVIPRDTELTLKMQPIVKAPAPAECFIGIATNSPAQAGAEGFFVVFTSQLQESDLEVTVSLADDGSPLAIAFLGIGSPQTFDAFSTTVTIPAGSDYAIVPFLAGPSDTVDPITVVASSAACGTASTELELFCIRDVKDITYRIEFTSFQEFGDSIDPFAFNAVVNPTLTQGNQSIAYFGIPPVGSLSIDDTNELGLSASIAWTLIDVVCAVVGRLCPEDVLTWETDGTIDLDWLEQTTWPAISDENVTQKSVIRIFGTPYGNSQAFKAPGFTAGQTVIIRAKINGVLIPLPRATFTITFV